MTIEWFAEENLRRAWQYAKSDLRDDFVFDIINHDDIGHNVDAVVKGLHGQLSANQYYPAPVLRIGVPKSLHSVRPGTSIAPVDLIVLYAMVQQLAPLLDPLLSESSYAYRLNPRALERDQPLFKDKGAPEKVPLGVAGAEEDGPIEVEPEFPYNWFASWKVFHSLTRAASSQYRCVARTDITAFFENVSLGLLREKLLEKLGSGQRDLIDRLFRTLEFWDWRPQGNLPSAIGIPQGNDVSSFLSNIYLLDLDEAMLRVVKEDNSKYFRYVDDVRLYTSDEDEARRALVQLEEVLRTLNLNVQTAKTEIIPSGQVDDAEVEAWLDKMGDQDSKAAREEAAAAFHREVFEVAVLDRWHRAYARSLTVLREANDDRAVDAALKLYLENPTQKVLAKGFTYLRHFCVSHYYSQAIWGRLADKTFTFPYHRAHLFRLAAYSREECQELRAAALREAVDAAAHWYPRVAALFCLSTFALEQTELARVAKLLRSESDAQVLRAAYVVALQYSGEQLRGVMDRLALFSAPHQDYFRRYCFQLFRHGEYSDAQLRAAARLTVAAPRFTDSVHRLDLFKASADPGHRGRFKEAIENVMAQCDATLWPRLAQRLKAINKGFVVMS